MTFWLIDLLELCYKRYYLWPIATLPSALVSAVFIEPIMCEKRQRLRHRETERETAADRELDLRALDISPPLICLLLNHKSEHIFIFRVMSDSMWICTPAFHYDGVKWAGKQRSHRIQFTWHPIDQQVPPCANGGDGRPALIIQFQSVLFILDLVVSL